MQFFTSSVKPLSLSSDSLNLPLVFLCVCVCIIHRDSSRGCCTVRRRGWRSLVSCCTPFFSDSIIWSFSNFWYLSTTFLSNTNTATSWRVPKPNNKEHVFTSNKCHSILKNSTSTLSLLSIKLKLLWFGDGANQPVWWTSWCRCRSSSTGQDPR